MGIRKFLKKVLRNPIVKVVAPIVAGAFLGPAAGALFTSATGVAVSAGIAGAMAGAATGAGLAAVNGDSVLRGTIGGALGGYTGGGFSGVFNPAVGTVGDLASGLQAASPGMTGGEAMAAAESYRAAGYSAVDLGFGTSVNGAYQPLAAGTAPIAPTGPGGTGLVGKALAWANGSGPTGNGSGTPNWALAAGALLPSLANAINPVPPPIPNVTTVGRTYSPQEQATMDFQRGEAERIYRDAVAAEIRNGNPAAAVAPQSPDTIAAQDALRQYSVGAGAQQVTDMLAATKYGLTGAMDVANNPYLAASIRAAITPMQQQFTDPGGVLSNIRSDATQAGQYGGTRQGLGEGIAGGRFIQAVGDTSSKMASDAYMKGQDTFAKTLSLAPGVLTAGQAPAQMRSAIGLQNEGYQQEVNNAASAAKTWDINKGFAPLANFTQLTKGLANPTAVTTAPPPLPIRKNLIGDAVSGALFANNIWGQLHPAQKGA